MTIDNPTHYYTHQVAVIGYVVRDGRFLLLKRATAPYVWAPPGGRLQRDEDPLVGLRREILEETALNARIIAPVESWFGEWKKGRYLFSVNYLVQVDHRAVQLSDEHSDFAWVTLEELRREDPVALHPEIGFRLKNFQGVADYLTAMKIDI